MPPHPRVLDEIRKVRRRVDALHRRALRRGEPDDWTESVLGELSTLVKALQVGEEELRAQNEALAAAQRVIVEERERYRQLFDSAPDAYLVTDEEGVIREANEAAGRLLGSPARRLAGKPLGVFVPVDRRNRFRLELLRRRAEPEAAEWELELQPRRGAEVAVACTVVPVRGPRGEEAGLRWLIREVTERRRAEERVVAARRAEAARETMEAILERITDGFIAFDREWHFTYVNGAAERILGVSRGDLLGRRLWRTLPQLAGTGLGDAFERAVREQVPTAVEDYLPLLDQWLTVHAYPSPDGLSVYFEDISERRAAEEERARIAGELMAERAILDQILHELPVGVVIAQSPSGRMLFGNRFVQSLWGGRFPMAGNVSGYSGEYRGFHPDGTPYQPEEWPLARAIRGELVRDEEIDLLIDDTVRRTISVNAAPVRDREGQVLAGVASVVDVTDAKAEAVKNRFLETVNRAITQSLDYRATVQSIARICVGAVADYCLVHVVDGSQVRAVGVAHAVPGGEEEVRALARMIPIEAGGANPIYQAIATGEALLIPEVDDEVLRRLAGEEHVERVRRTGLASAVIVPLKARGRTLGALSLGRSADAPEYGPADLPLVEDVARRAAVAVDNARLYREAQKAAEARQKLLGVVSHDLRNALNAAVMHTEMLRIEVPEPDGRQERRLGSLRRSLDHMQRLVEDLLDVDSLETGRLSLQLKAVDVPSLVEEVREIFTLRAAGLSVALEIGVSAALPRVRADRVRLVQVLSNLLGNALQHTAAGGRVSLAVARDGEAVRFTVRDTGSGIEPEDLPRVFERFWRGPASRHAGTGLGLTISRGLVRAHGGEIGVESAPGEGSTFWFTVPAAG